MAIEEKTTAESFNRGGLAWMIPFLTLRGVGDGSAIGYLFAGGVAYSLIPLAIALANAGESPFLFTAGFRLGAFAGQLVIVIIAFRSLVFNKHIWALMKSKVFSWLILGVVIGKTEYAFLAWSTYFIDISVSAVLYECWPIFLILVTAWLFRNQERYKHVTFWSYTLIGIAFVGVAFVVFSQSDGSGNFTVVTISNLLYGLALVFVAIILTAFAGFAFRWGSDLANEVKKTDTTFNSESVALYGALVASVFGNAMAFLVSISAAPFADIKSFDSGLAVMPVALIAGVSAYSIADGLWSLSQKSAWIEACTL